MNSKVSNILDENNQINMDQLRAILDEEQFQAVTADFQNILVRANAGSGKTRVLTSRVAYLLASGVPEHQIMLLTFTRKASREMMERVGSLLGRNHIQIMGGTFHSVGVRFLRKYGELLGYGTNFTILDTEDSKRLIGEVRKDYLKETGLNHKDFPKNTIIQAYSSTAINKNLTLEEVNKSRVHFDVATLKGIKTILEAYRKKKKELNAMDFDDILVNFSKLLDIPRIQEIISKQYQYVLIDEYQDINHIQAKIIQSLNKGNDHLFAVGDPNQSIYGWRGSEVSYIEKFNKHFSNAKQYYITYNYRSDGEILKVAEYSINMNYKNKKNKTKIYPVLPHNNKPIVYSGRTEEEQAEYISETIQNYVKQGVPYKEIAVLIRKNRHSMALEKAFRKRGIPYKLLAGMSFFERKHVKDILAFMRFVDNPKDKIAFSRMAKLFEGIGDKTIEKLHIELSKQQYQIEALANVKVTGRAKNGVEMLLSILMKITQSSYGASKMVGHIINEFYEHYLKMSEEDYEDRMDDLNYLWHLAEQYGNLSDFLSEMILDDTKEEGSGEEVVTISTVHKSKGLEWDCVFIPYLNDGDFSISSKDDKKDSEEERRVFYVAVTRSRHYLHLCYVEGYSFSNGFIPAYPSVFITELKPHHTLNYSHLR